MILGVSISETLKWIQTTAIITFFLEKICPASGIEHGYDALTRQGGWRGYPAVFVAQFCVEALQCFRNWGTLKQLAKINCSTKNPYLEVYELVYVHITYLPTIYNMYM